MVNVKWKPEGMHTVTPSFAVEGCADAIEAYKKVFGAIEKSRAPDPSGKKVWHADLVIGDSHVFVNDYFPEMAAQMGDAVRKGGAGLWLYVENPDEIFERAKAAGWKVLMPMADMFWGDRSGTVMDRWGNQWTLAKRIREMTPDEMRKAGEEAAKNSGRR